MIRIMLLSLCLFAASAQAGAYRCNERDGRVSYRNQPCPGGSFQQRLPVASPSPPELFRVPAFKEVRAGTAVRVVPLASNVASSDHEKAPGAKRR